MKKLFKKSIALVLSAALCLTALIGCLTVSADGTTETTKPAFTLGTVSGKAGETVTLNGSITVISGISAHDVSFTFPEGFTVAGISGDANLVVGDELNSTAEGANTSTSANYNYVKDQDYTEKTVNGKTVIRFVNVYQLDAASTYNFSFSVKIPENATANDYNVTVDAKVAKDNTTDNTETLLDAADITVTVGKITVKPTLVLDADITSTYSSGLGETVYISFVVPKAALDKYSDFYMEVKTKTPSGTWNFTDAETFVIKKSQLGDDYLKAAGSNYYFYFRDAGLYSLCVDIKATVYCKDANGNVVAYSNEFVNNIANLLKTDLYPRAVAANSANLIAVITDVLVVGDTAVKSFTANYPNSDYAKLDSPLKDFEGEQTTVLDTSKFNLIDQPFATDGEVSGGIGAGLSASVQINSYIYNIASGNSVNDYSVKFSYTDALKGQITTTVNGADMTVGGTVSVPRYYSYFKKLSLYSSNADITVEIQKDGSTINTAHYSVEQYYSVVLNNASVNQNLKDLITALAKLGVSFRAARNIAS